MLGSSPWTGFEALSPVGLFSKEQRGMTGLKRDHPGVCCFQGEANSSLSRGWEEKRQLLWIWQPQTPGMFPASSVCMVGVVQKQLLLWGDGGVREGGRMCQDSLEKVRGRPDNAKKGMDMLG